MRLEVYILSDYLHHSVYKLSDVDVPLYRSTGECHGLPVLWPLLLLQLSVSSATAENSVSSV